MKRGFDYIGVGSGAMIFDEQGKVFLAKRGQAAKNESGMWDFPGGTIELGEKCEDGIKREIKEEFDIDIEVIELLEVIDHILPEENQHWVSPSYIARLISGTPKIMEPEKCDQIKWIYLEEIDETKLTLPSHSNYKKYIEKYGFNKRW